ncbi:pyridoxamine kinase [Ligilactobacillus sp. WILCCON 0076]|uniref:pyridoxal kinase n=1 Tax=Ligilactobacillus ubinensis TaxID=2876789 RepID=A0A9X2JMK4_9LACO|nr:pyridoxamine kinase [Ligilactobacillus ubinensis]MCP0887161.1 pyridoxamine kinase [Ligilactobacillus ubinensis]
MSANILISQDLSCVGQVSLSVALPLLGACGFQPNVLPTSLLSTHTGGFGDNTYLDLAPEMIKILQHWQELDLKFPAIYLGYLGMNPLDVWLSELHNFYPPDNLLLIDPVMGDHGQLYRGFNQSYVAKMRLLIRKASIITPNLTEAAFLLNDPKLYTATISINEAKKLAQKIAEKFEIPAVLITGLTLKDSTIGVVGFERKNTSSWSLTKPKLDGTFFGTGDLFASVLLACLLASMPLYHCANTAIDFIYTAIKHTSAKHDPRYGVNYAAGLPDLLAKLKETKE